MVLLTVLFTYQTSHFCEWLLYKQNKKNKSKYKLFIKVINSYHRRFDNRYMEISKHFRGLPQTRWPIRENPFFCSIYRGILSEWWRAPGCCCTRRCLEDPGRRGSREPSLALGEASSLVPVTWQTAEVLVNCVRTAFCEFFKFKK